MSSAPQDDLACKEVSRMLSDGLDQELPADERERLRVHLALCRGCRALEQQLAVLQKALQTLGRHDAPADEPKQ